VMMRYTSVVCVKVPENREVRASYSKRLEICNGGIGLP
jgi:hypothetical protein